MNREEKRLINSTSMTMGTRVYVGRISYDVRERDIEKFFKGYGRIREILMKDGFAFVVILLLLLFIMLCFNLIFIQLIGIR